MLTRRHKVCETLILVTSHGPTALNGQILLKMRVEVLFKGEVAHESHTADAAVELDALENLSVCFLSQSTLNRLRLNRRKLGRSAISMGIEEVILTVGVNLGRRRRVFCAGRMHQRLLYLPRIPMMLKWLGEK